MIVLAGLLILLACVVLGQEIVIDRLYRQIALMDRKLSEHLSLDSRYVRVIREHEQSRN